MKIVILMEDSEVQSGLFYEHGFSVYVETESTKILVDAGASDKTWENAKKLGIDIESVDHLFLSHGHYDHSGGIMGFAGINPAAPIYMHPKAVLDYYNLRDGNEKYIGIDKAICKLARVQYLSENRKIDEQISVFCDATGRRKWPGSNLILKKKENGIFVQDSFDHEQYVVVSESGKTVLISGCAHNGILNILDRFREVYGCDPDVVISGFHMMKRGDYEEDEKTLIADIAEELVQTDIQFYTGHCTSRAAYEIMKPVMGDQIVYVHAGQQIII
ncbi:MAG: MBL fold metallo-hydrolase [Clostridiales bacterium]|nr:MBL fold metallo-hydrolase [Candidatus Blautia equi]